MHKSSLYKTLGIIILSWFFYRSFLLNREPYFLDEQVSWYLYYIISILAFSQLFLFFSLIRRFQRKPSGIVIRMMSKVLEIIYFKPLRHVGEVMLKRKLIIDWIEHWTAVLESLIRSKKSIMIIVILFYLYPKLLVGCLLLVDVFLFEEIKLFYSKISWLLIPLIFQGIIGLINMHNQHRMERLLSQEITVIYDKEQIIITPHEKRGDMLQEELDKHTVEYIYQTNIQDLIQAFSIVTSTRVYLILNMIITLLFLTGWLGCLITITKSYLIAPSRALYFLFLAYLGFPWI
jgi:hypothetical protein